MPVKRSLLKTDDAPQKTIPGVKIKANTKKVTNPQLKPNRGWRENNKRSSYIYPSLKILLQLLCSLGCSLICFWSFLVSPLHNSQIITPTLHQYFTSFSIYCMFPIFPYSILDACSSSRLHLGTCLGLVKFTQQNMTLFKN